MITNAAIIYYQLRNAGLTKAGALGLAGNWLAESGCEAHRLQGDFTEGRLLSKAYVADVTAGRISRTQFARDQKGFGLAQWTYYTRKEALYDFWKNSGAALDDVRMQVQFALSELSGGEYASLWSVLKSTDDIWTATDKVCRLYERPYYNNVDARFRYAKELEAELDRAESEPVTTEPESEPSPAAEPAKATFWPPRTICNGMSGDDTAVLQAVLKARGYNVNVIDGHFAKWLEDEVKAFQESAFPNQPNEWDGIVGPKTWGALLRWE